MSEIVIYEDDIVSLETTVEKDTLWLTQQQIAELFDVKRPAITKHISNIFKTHELTEEEVCSKMEHTTKHGAIVSKTQKKQVKIYNLDMIISIGYRVNSKRATHFRRWATNILKQHLMQGYTLNQKRLQQKGIEEFQKAIALYIIKDHPFNDGNKRIGAFLFILFLQKNGILYRNNVEAKINDNALVALTLMIAKSLPEQKDTVIALVVNMLVE